MQYSQLVIGSSVNLRHLKEEEEEEKNTSFTHTNHSLHTQILKTDGTENKQ